MKPKKLKASPDTLIIHEGIDPIPNISKKVLSQIKLSLKSKENIQYYINGILNSDRTILSKSITLIESSLRKHQSLAQEIIANCLPYSGKAIRIGVTGVPGVGKSTFIESFGTFLTNKGHKVAVLAVDPSSTRSKGSILGDKTRMEYLATDPMAFIRPSPSAGSLGGVARKTRESIILCESAGYDVIIVETVGVGQSETMVRSMVDLFLLLLIPGAGDELQGIKRGIMEMADLLVVNKVDGDNLTKASIAIAEIKNAIHYLKPSKSGWVPQVVPCSSLTKDGIPQVWTIINDYIEFLKKNEFFHKLRTEQSLHILHYTLEQEIISRFYQNDEIRSILKKYEDLVINDAISPYVAVKELLDLYLSGNHNSMQDL